MYRQWEFIVVAAGLSLWAPSTRAADENLQPVAHWSFEDHDAGVMDAVGKHCGTVKGAPMPAPGVAGKALRFDGRNDVVIVPASPALGVSEAAFSVSAWVNPYAFNRGQQMIVAKNVYSANQREWGLMIDKDDCLRFYLWQDGWKTVGVQTELQRGHWHHVAVTVEKGHGRLYVNGKLAGEDPLAPSGLPTDAPLTLGGVCDGGRVMQAFRGALDEVSLYREVLTPAAIQTLAAVQTIPHTVEVAEPVKIWDGGVVPKSAEIPVLEGVTFHVIKRHEPETDGYQWLHGVGLVWHKGRLYASFGHNKGSENTRGEEARGRISDDGGQTWGEPFTIASGNESLGVSHGVFLSHQGTLWSFHGAFYDQFQRTHARAYVLDEVTGKWQARGVVVDAGFWPLQEPQKMEDGNWIMAGARISHGYDVVGNLPAVAISHGDDFTRWDLVVIPCDDRVPVRSIWGESNVIVNGSRITSLARWGNADPTALVSESTDYGRTWLPLRESNLPMADSKPCAGTLSNGQRYLIGTTTADSGRRRSPLTIAVSRPGERHFSKLFVIRHAVLEGGPDSQERSALSYPYAVEHAGKLYVGYSNSGGRGGNHNSAELAIIPIESL